MAVVILAIILITGHPEPIARPQTGSRAPQAALVPPDRVRSYQQQLAADLAREQAQSEGETTVRGGQPTTARATPAGNLTADDQRRREYQSLFADNVALSRRPPDRPSYGERRSAEIAAPAAPAVPTPDIALLQQLLTSQRTGRTSTPTSTPPAPTMPTATEGPKPIAEALDKSPQQDAAQVSDGPGIQRLLEGTVIETVLLNRLDGTFTGPVECLVTTPVYSHDRHTIVIPAGARVLGSASPVQSWGDSRLAVSFHRLLMPDGRTYSLDGFKGLGQIGDTGLKDSVNRHYFQVFGASLAIGALSGLAQYGSRTSVDSVGFGDAYRQATGSSLAASAGRVLDRYLNVLPTITIREGYRIKVYLTNDLRLPAYAASVSGGDR
jgi:type IV secretory pathway VirB10-like protein